MTEHRCRRDDRCAEYVRDHDTKVKSGAYINASDGLCNTCTRHVDRALTDLPADYVRLNQMLGRGDSGSGDKISGTRELSIPIRVEVEALQAAMLWETGFWAGVVRSRHGVHTEITGRPGVRLAAACSWLTQSLPALLAIREDAYMSHGPHEWEPADRDGLGAALMFLALHNRARHFTGQIKLVHRLPIPCPRCERASLERADGSDNIDCAGCASQMTRDEYEHLCLTLTEAA